MAEKTVTCLNGHFIAAARAAVGVADRGFRFGDGVFETVRVEGGVPYQWPVHMERLQLGLSALGIASLVDDFTPHAKKLLSKNAAGDGYLRLAVSRGVGSRGYLPHPPGMPAHWVMEWLPGLAEPTAPCTLWLSTIPRIPPQCLPTQCKLAQGLNSSLALLEAQRHGADEALQLGTDGALSEAASANLFWLKEGALHTPAIETGCVAGTTRAALIRLGAYPVQLVHAGLASLETAEAVFLTNCRVGIWPVARLEPLGWTWRSSHPIHRRLMSDLSEDRKRHGWASP